MKRKIKILVRFICYFQILTLSISCNKLVDVPLPIDKVTVNSLFDTDASATSAVLGTYSQMTSPTINFSCGSITMCGGLSSDELFATSAAAIAEKEFSDNAISTTNATIKSKLWLRAYLCIYQINTCINGLTVSSTLTPATKNQLLGESKFTRAFFYFNMINLFGEVPLITSTDFEINKRLPRTPLDEIKTLIRKDLDDAILLLPKDYPTTGPVRPNKYTALALLSRYFLYEKKWSEAEQAASQIIDSKAYSLNNDLNEVFLANNREAIWQLEPVNKTYNTFEGANFIPNKSSAAPPKYAITRYLINSFETGDKRFTNWIRYKTIGTDTFYYPFKYKIALTSGSQSTEYYTIFRLAEQYLIRAESRAQLNNIPGAISDLNVIRNRAKDESIEGALPPLPASLSQSQTLAATKQENKIELFCEWGHRWFDLIRQNDADNTLKAIKPGWQPTDVRYPLPLSEMLLNTTLIQNPGYN
jgi:hypothetical protein